VLINKEEALRMAEAARLMARRTTGTAERLADEIVNWLRPASPPEGTATEPMLEQEHQRP